jgi:hypothetical protein
LKPIFPVARYSLKQNDEEKRAESGADWGATAERLPFSSVFDRALGEAVQQWHPTSCDR